MTPPAPALDRSIFRQVLTAHTSPDDWSRWFKDIQVSLTSSEVLLEAPSRFVANQVVSRFLSQVESAARTAGAAASARIRVTVNPNREKPTSQPPTPTGPASRPPQKPDRPSPSLRHPANHHRFDNFEVGSSNFFAYAAATSVAESPGHRYNPLFIYGASGLGKTHLLLSIAHGARQARPTMAVHYCTSEKFVQEFIQCVGKRRMQAFRRRFREVDMLLLDDFQFLEGKEQTLEEFYWTFDSLHQAGKHIVLGCDRSPRDLNTLAERTRSRLFAGVVAEIIPPGFETRMAILQRLQERSPMSLDHEVLRIIADHFPANIRDLASALRQLHAYASLTKLPVTPEAALQHLAPMSGLPSPTPTPQTIIAACADAFGTTSEEILHRNRRPLPSVARQVAMYLAREVTGLPYARIGTAFQRGHSTVLSAHRRVVSLIAGDPEFAERVTTIHNAVNKP